MVAQAMPFRLLLQPPSSLDSRRDPMPASPVSGQRLCQSPAAPAAPASTRRRLCVALLAAGALLCTQPALADLARIRQNGSLKVAVYKGLPPFSAAAGSQYEGIDVA